MEPASIPARALLIFISKSPPGPHTIGVAMPGDDAAGADDVYAVYPDNAACYKRSDHGTDESDRAR